MARVLILLGAGATVADVSTRAQISRPPLDKQFFSLCRKAGHRPGAGYNTRINRINAYMRRTYAADITEASEDSLEQVMGQLYTDLLNPTLARTARPAFLALLRLFNERLAETTNNIAATQKRFLYRILSYYLAENVAPSEITIVTFNQDLQAEKILELLALKAKWQRYRDQIFNFPGCYDLNVPPHRVTKPTSGPPEDLFPSHADDPQCIRVLKLHGSLNWYSTHNSRTPSTKAMFNPSRKLSITRRRDIYVDMTVSGPSRKSHTLPLVIPPVTHKSAVLHDEIRPIWTEAERRLTEADHLVIFGYSCPALDFESSNMLRRSQLASSHTRTISLIDPDSGTATRYVGLLQPTKLSYYPSAADFLTDHPH
jgi:hypothetical protein